MAISDHQKDALDRLVFPGGVPSKVVKEQRRVARKETPVPYSGPAWDRNPKVVKVAGEDKEFFRVSALAEALGKSTKTIYAWVAAGKMPDARYRSAIKRDALKDKTAKGDRLYTRYQIEAAVSAAKQTGVLTGKNIDWARFSALVREAWAR